MHASICACGMWTRAQKFERGHRRQPKHHLLIQSSLEMESAITEAFLQTVRGLVQKCMEDTEVEARKYALVMKTLYGSGATVSAAPDAQRIQMLEGTLDALLQEVGILDTRLNEIEQNNHDTWNGLGGGAAEPLGKDEVIDVEEGAPVTVVKTEQAPEPVAPAPAPAPAPVVPAPAPAPIVPAPAPAPVVPAPTPAPVVSAPAPAPVVPAPAPAPVVPAPTPAPVVPAPASEEDEEENSLEEITVDGKTYYKDGENLVYVLDEDGELDDTPVGRYLAKSNKIRFFPPPSE
jgi:hypothetical protein